MKYLEIGSASGVKVYGDKWLASLLGATVSQHECTIMDRNFHVSDLID